MTTILAAAGGDAWLSTETLLGLVFLLQLLALGYLAFAFRRITRNQVQMAEALRELLEAEKSGN